MGEEDWLRFFAMMGTALAESSKAPLVRARSSRNVNWD